LSTLGQGLQRGLDRLVAVRGDKSADGQADDRQVFERHKQGGQAAVHRVSADRGQQDDHVPDDQ
jgi:hypothetical protein